MTATLHGEEQVRLLDADPDLAVELDPGEIDDARAGLVVPIVAVPVGDWSPHPDTTCFGYVVLEGLVTREVGIIGHRFAQVLGAGDIVSTRQPMWEPVPVEHAWTVRSPTILACLDDRYLLAVRRWPRLLTGFAARIAEQVDRLAVQQAICQLPRVDMRLLALFWLLAERWGTVTASGVHLKLDLTHDLAGRLVGARRPTVTLALQELTGRGAVVRMRDRTWLLVEPVPDSHGSPMPAPGPEDVVVPSEPARQRPSSDRSERQTEFEEQRTAILGAVARLSIEHRLQQRQLDRSLEVMRERLKVNRRLRGEQAARLRHPAPSGG